MRSTARRRSDIGYHLLPRLVGRARAMLVEGYFRDIGTVDAYQRAQQEWPVRARTDDHHPDAVAHRPARRRDRPA